MDNPYLAAYRAATAHQRDHDPRGLGPDGAPWLSCMCDDCRGLARQRGFYGLLREYAWSIPTDTALDTIAGCSPHGVLEVGAGAGYWAWQLRGRGVDVLAFDPDPHGRAGWSSGRRWTGVGVGDHTAAAQHPGRTLLLCRPEPEWGAAAVDAYRGRTIVYVGQVAERPAQLSSPARVVELPRWAGATDRLEVHER
ncbi:hypothetical protein PA7_15080 [Pseudonocardia asaccharolytica DSM 44247 = NBRC 16224]|uniref:Methyltransferase type 11 domain-containing protein n=1 Tax=Pseudonocardia asaccharolytica DSM 44247 = NBRC 16224 TaxID=1123024 RepID=A0A511CYQ0_9PSEU|nr:hypothetical protein PA7_15080 [Pseudonocardia asaccharolytica DSM 44247 = NBRC 16224]